MLGFLGAALANIVLKVTRQHLGGYVSQKNPFMNCIDGVCKATFIPHHLFAIHPVLKQKTTNVTVTTLI